MADKTKGTALFLLIILALIWGTSFILIKQGLKAFNAGEVGALRVASASLFFVPIALTLLKELKPHHYWKLFVSGMLGIFIPAFLFATAQTHMDSSVAGILNTLTPLFTMLLGAVVFHQKFKGWAIVGIILGFAGTFMLSLSRSGGSISGFNAFALLIVIACFCYGCNLNFIKYKIPDVRAITITSISLMLVGPLALIYLFFFTEFTAKLSADEGAWRALGFVVLLGLMSTAVATVIFNKLVKISTPLFASSVTYLIPIVAVMWGVMDNEVLTAGHFIGMVSIIGGVYLTNRKK